MKVIFDTNAYRNLAKTIFTTDNDAENRAKILQLAEKEQAKKIQIELSYHVLLELLCHLSDEKDEDYESCKSALNLAILHCGVPKISDSLELTILEEFDKAKFNLYKHKYEDIWKTSCEFATNGQSDIFKRNVQILKDELRWIKEGVSKGFDLMTIDFKNGKIKKNPLVIIDSINYEYYFQLLSKMAYCGVIPDNISTAIDNQNLEGIIDYIEENRTVFDKIIEKHFVGFAHTNKIINNKYGDKKPMGRTFSNNFLDIEICFLIDRFSDSILVTNDGFSSTNASKTKIHSTFEEIGFSSRIKDLNSYLEFIELPQFKI